MKELFRISNFAVIALIAMLASPAFLYGQEVIINGNKLSSDQLAELEKRVRNK